MARFVADASATMPWCFEDEATSWSDGLLERVIAGDVIVVPAHWSTEVSNALLMAERRSRIQPGRAELFRDQLDGLFIEMQPSALAEIAKTVLALGRKHRLTAYDAAYLELAMRLDVELATLDGELRLAALSEGVVLA